MKPLVPKSKRGRGRLTFLTLHAVSEVLEAYQRRQMSLFTAEIVAHLPPDDQRREVARLVADKEKVFVMPMTEQLLLKQQRDEQMRAEVIALDGLNEFQRAFKEAWQKLHRKFERTLDYGEMWRLAETVVIRLSAPAIEATNDLRRNR